MVITHQSMYRKILCFVMLFFLLSSTFVSAASKDLIKEYYFTSDSDQNFYYAAPESIKEDGKEYMLKSTTYEYIGENESYISEIVNYENLDSEEIPTKETFTVDGEDVSLSLIKDDEIKYTETIEYVTDTFNQCISKPDIPSSKTVTADDEEFTATLVSVDEEKTAKTYTAKVKFTGAKGSLYYLNGKKLELGDSSPLWTGCEADVITYLGLPEGSTVKSGKWTTDYVTEGEKVVRYAEFSGTRPAVNYTATYSYSTYSCKATYDNGEDKYKVKAVCTYGKVGLSTAQKVAIGAALVLLAGLLMYILYIIARRKKQDIE